MSPVLNETSLKVVATVIKAYSETGKVALEDFEVVGTLNKKVISMLKAIEEKKEPEEFDRKDLVQITSLFTIYSRGTPTPAESWAQLGGVFEQLRVLASEEPVVET